MKGEDYDCNLCRKIQPRSDNCRGFRRIQKTVNPKEPSIAHWSLNLNGEEAILCHGAGHLCGLAPAEDYDERYKYWSFDNYPIIPEHFITRVKDNNYSRLAYDYVKQFFDKADLIINATDADREGELILRTYMKCCIVQCLINVFG